MRVSHSSPISFDIATTKQGVAAESAVGTLRKNAPQPVAPVFDAGASFFWVPAISGKFPQISGKFLVNIPKTLENHHFNIFNR